MKIEGLVQLKTGEAVRGIISHRLPFFRYLKVENPTAIEKGGTESKADGIIWIPKPNVLFIQQIMRVTA